MNVYCKKGVGGLLLLSLLVCGCRWVNRMAWAAEGRTAPYFQWPPSLMGADLHRRDETQSLSHFLVGLIAEENGDLDTAQRHYGLAQKYDPKAASIALRRGTVHLRRNELTEAIHSFEVASRMNPADPRPHFYLGILYVSEERFKEATEQYASILREDPSNLGALSYLVDLYLLQEKLQEALAIYEKILQQRPDSAVAHFHIGVLYAKAGFLPEAIQHFRETVTLDPSYVEARLGLAVSLELAGQLKEAREEFLRALEMEPANARLIQYLAQLSYRLRNLDEAAQWVSRYLSFRPRDVQGYLELGGILIEQGRWEEAVKVLRAALALEGIESDPSSLWLALGQAYRQGTLFPQAEESYRRAMTLAPLEIKAPLLLGELYHQWNRFKEAEESYQTAFQINPDEPEVLNGLGFLYTEMGVHLDEAEVLIRRALSQDPKNGAYLDSLGWVYFKKGSPQKALTLLKEASLRRPDSEVFEHLGQVYLSLGDIQAAQKAWGEGLKLHPSHEAVQRLESQIKALHKKKKDR